MSKYLIAFSVILFLCSGFIDNKYIEHTSSISLTNEIRVSNGTVSGTVIIPNQNTQSRSFRGSSYRSRGNASTSSSTSEEGGSQYENTIISAHPLSYSLPDDISGDPVAIEQKNATFTPNVTPLTIGTVVQFINQDAFFHNVFSLTPGSKFNIGRRATGDVYSKQIETPKWKVTGVGPITLFCDVHSQMKATILSLDTIYYTRVNEDGSYEISDLPEGEYEIRVYSPGFEIISSKVTVTSNGHIKSNFNLTS